MSDVVGLDSVSAAIILLRNGFTGEVATVFGGRVERPIEEVRKLLDSSSIVLVRATPGAGSRPSYLPTGRYNLLTWVYAPTHLEMTKVNARVDNDLALVQHEVVTDGADSALVRWITRTGGPTQLHDADIDVPFLAETWTMLIDDMELVP